MPLQPPLPVSLDCLSWNSLLPAFFSTRFPPPLSPHLNVNIQRETSGKKKE